MECNESLVRKFMDLLWSLNKTTVKLSLLIHKCDEHEDEEACGKIKETLALEGKKLTDISKALIEMLESCEA